MLKNSKIRLALANFIIILSIAAVCSLSYLAYQYNKAQYTKSIDTYNKNLRRLTRLISGSTELDFLTIDQTLRRATEKQYFTQIGGEYTISDMQRDLAVWVSKTPHIDSMLFTDNNGIVQTIFRKGENNIDIRPGDNFISTNHFNFHKQNPDQELLISIYKTPSQPLNNRVIISRRIEKKNGEFAGLVAAIMDNNYIYNFMNSIDTGNETEVYLLLNEDDFLADNVLPNNSKLALIKAIMSEINFKASGKGEIVILEKKINDALNMFAFQKVPHLPIKIAIIAKEEDIFANWREARGNYIFLISVFSVFTFTITLLTILLSKKVILARQAEKKATLASNAKTEFLAKMSHELRTPLNAIIGFSEMLSSGYFGKINHTQFERINDINMCGNHLLELINDILEFSRGEANKLVLTEEDVEVYNVVKQALRMVEQRAKQKGIELVNTISREAPVLWADNRKLKQILLNLLSNAIKFTNSGGKVIISCHFDAVKNFIITISDTGIGIPSQDIPRAMAVFEQVHKDRMHEGTGLGLPLCKMLTELHGGTFKLESKVNVGTKASVILPSSRVQKRKNLFNTTTSDKTVLFPVLR